MLLTNGWGTNVVCEQVLDLSIYTKIVVSLSPWVSPTDQLLTKDLEDYTCGYKIAG